MDGGSQIAPAVLMVEPAAFAYNLETAATNRFQSAAPIDRAGTRARSEWRGLAEALEAAGVRVCRVADTAIPAKPDAVFPNNWVSFHDDGTVVLYPMQASNRRLERRDAVVEAVERDLAFRTTRRVDLTHHEAAGRFLEGTGSLVLDHVARVAYACRSPRTDPAVAAEWAAAMGYALTLFDAATPDGTPVYHTNVLLWIGTDLAGVGAGWIAAADRDRVLAQLAATGRDIVELGTAELLAFAGNALELRTAGSGTAGGHAPMRSGSVIALSATAVAALSDANRARLEGGVDRLIVAEIPTIERLGGGSVRCMLAEVPAVPVAAPT